MTTLHPNVGARIVELREIMPEPVVLAVSPEGAAFVEYQADDGEWLSGMTNELLGVT